MGGTASFKRFINYALAGILEEGKSRLLLCIAYAKMVSLTNSQAPFWSLCHDYYHKYDQFRADYDDAVGREPFVEASPRYRWYVCPLPFLIMLTRLVKLTLCTRKIGESVTNDDYEEYLDRLDTFRTWFDKNVMPLSSDSDDIMILPAGIAEQKYRDEPPR